MQDINKVSELEQYKERLERTLAGTNCGTFHHDFTKELIYFDERALQLLGMTEPISTLDNWLNIIYPDDRGVASFIQRELENQSPHINITYRILRNECIQHIKVDSFVKYLHGKPKISYGLIQDISDLKEQQIELERNNNELEHIAKQLRTALEEIKTLKGFIPICSYCHKIRDDEGVWNRLEAYLTKHSDVELSHGICPDCIQNVCSEAGFDGR